MATGIWELQQGVIAAVGANSEVYSLVGGQISPRIYDAAPRDATFPYITVGDDEPEEAGSCDGIAYRVQVKIHVWDHANQTSRKNVKKIGDALTAALHMQTFSVTGHNIVYCVLKSSLTEQGGFDELTWHGVAVFEIMLEKTS
jgi:hypothetical protein